MQQVPERSWNEYDDGSDAENEPYTIFIDPNAEATYPGAKAVAFVVDKINTGTAKFKSLVKKTPERQPLLPSQNNSQISPSAGYFTNHSNHTETSIESVDDSSSTDFPTGYETHYATFPSISDQKLSMYQEMLLFRTSIACFITSIILLLITSILMATGRHKLRVEVDAGVIVGTVSSLAFSTAGAGAMYYRRNKGWSILFACVTWLGCWVWGVWNLVFVVGNTSF
jgi:hypothetical protein